MPQTELQLRKTTGDLSFDSTLTHLDTEVTILTPVLVPTVSNLPILDTIFHTPTNQLHSMSTKVLSSDMLIDSTLVSHEILVNVKGDFHGSFSHQLSLDLISSTNGISHPEHMLVLFVRLRVSLLTLLHTLRSRLSLTTRRISSSTVVLTLGEGVSIAPVRCSILSSSRHSIHMEPGPSSCRETSVTTESASLAASEKIFSRKTILIRSLRSNTKTISSSFSSSESPARTTNRLITNLL